MPRQSVIKILVEIVIPYDRKAFGAAANAESISNAVHDTLVTANNGAHLIMWLAKHTSITVPAPAAATAAAAAAAAPTTTARVDDVGEIPGFPEEVTPSITREGLGR